MQLIECFKSDIVSAAIRDFIEKHNPRYEHLNMIEDNVKVIDRERNDIATLYFRNGGLVQCDIDESSDCEHIEWALQQPKIKKALEEKG